MSVVASVDGRVAAAQAELATIKDQMASLRRDERSRRSGRVKLEPMTLRVQHESDSQNRIRAALGATDSLSSIDRSSSSESNDLPE